MKHENDSFARRSIRLKNFAYSQPGWYYITICSHNRKCSFGRVVEGKLLKTPIGRAVHDEWLKSFILRPELSFDQWTLMPNHLHAIVSIYPPDGKAVSSNELDAKRAHSRAPLQREAKSLSSFIAQFKATATRRVRQELKRPELILWQRNYFEHVIRTDRALNALREYIVNNPRQWELDAMYPRKSAGCYQDLADSICQDDSRFK